MRHTRWDAPARRQALRSGRRRHPTRYLAMRLGRQPGRVWRGVRTYFRQARQAAALDHNAIRTPRLVLDFPAWAMSRGENSLVDEGVPWINFAARDALERALGKSDKVFEFGSGGSTVFFARRVGELTSIEYDPGWYETIRLTLERLDSRNWTYKLKPATRESQAARDSARQVYISDVPGFEEMSFAAFASSIDEYPDAYFDWVLIDGRVRVGCFLHAHRKLRIGGHLVLDDAQRDRYRAVHAATQAANWPVRRYHGPGPKSNSFWETAIWTKTRDLQGIEPPS